MDNQIVFAPVSLGELVDKIVILEIKKERISDEVKLSNIRTELQALRDIRPPSLLDNAEIQVWEMALRSANEELWD